MRTSLSVNMCVCVCVCVCATYVVLVKGPQIEVVQMGAMEVC